jgi:hypothetical protein
MCNDLHPFIGDPLSMHLNGLMSQGLIEKDLIDDVEAYIRRRQKTVWVSNLFCRRELKRDDTAGGTQFRKSLVLPIGSLFAQGVRIILNSRFYDTCRRLWCYLHGWHIARLE